MLEVQFPLGDRLWCNHSTAHMFLDSFGDTLCQLTISKVSQGLYIQVLDGLGKLLQEQAALEHFKTVLLIILLGIGGGAR